WYSWTGNPVDLKRDFVSQLNVRANRVIAPPELLTCLLQKEAVTSTVSLMRRDAILRAGGFEESFRGLYEDQAFFAKISSQESIYVANLCWYKWRKHSNSSCSNALSTGDYRTARLTFLTWLETYISDRGIVNAELTTALRNQIWKCRHPSLNRVWNTLGNWMR